MNKKKIVIWGAGIYGSRLLKILGTDQVCFFVDNSPLKRDTKLGKKTVYNPDQIHNWNELYVYVPYNFYDEIKLFLTEKGLRENYDFVKYGKQIEISYDFAKKNIQTIMDNLNNVHLTNENYILIWGGVWFSNDTYRKLIGQIQYIYKNVSYIFSSDEEVDEKNELKEESTFIPAPLICADRVSMKIENKNDIDKYNNKINQTKYLECKEQLRITAGYDNEESLNMAISVMYDYFSCLINKVAPKIVFSQNCVRVASIILDQVCKEKNIPIVYVHEGILPGTMCCDAYGEVGKSIPAVFPKAFRSLLISNDEIEQAKMVWDYLYNSKLNRKVQPQNNAIEIIKSKIKADRKTVVFLGQNDPLSHMIPYTEGTKKFHSPIFESSVDAAVYMGKLCEKNNWNFVYKPHPNYVVDDIESILPKSTIYVEFCDINDLIDLSDVVVTILSTSNYNALTRYKPVVMLGYTQTKGQGCTYEAFEKEQIEERIKEALTNGFSDEMQQRFVEHIARLNKYYLYDDMADRELRYGKTIPESFDDFFSLQRLLENKE